jgi:hypothetical protein
MSKSKYENSPKIILGFDTREQAEKYFKGSSYQRINGCNGCELDADNQLQSLQEQRDILKHFAQMIKTNMVRQEELVFNSNPSKSKGIY